MGSAAAGAAGIYLQSLREVDAERVGLYGGSYGGYLTAMALARDSALGLRVTS